MAILIEERYAFWELRISAQNNLDNLSKESSRGNKWLWAIIVILLGVGGAAYSYVSQQGKLIGETEGIRSQLGAEREERMLLHANLVDAIKDNKAEINQKLDKGAESRQSIHDELTAATTNLKDTQSDLVRRLDGLTVAIGAIKEGALTTADVARALDYYSATVAVRLTETNRQDAGPGRAKFVLSLPESIDADTIVRCEPVPLATTADSPPYFFSCRIKDGQLEIALVHGVDEKAAFPVDGLPLNIILTLSKKPYLDQ